MEERLIRRYKGSFGFLLGWSGVGKEIIVLVVGFRNFVFQCYVIVDYVVFRIVGYY